MVYFVLQDLLPYVNDDSDEANDAPSSRVAVSSEEREVIEVVVGKY